MHGDGEFRGAFGLAHDLVDGEPFDARHGGDRHAGFLSVGDEKRPDQIGGRERMLAHHAPDPVGAAQAARTLGQIEPGRAFARRGRVDRHDARAAFDGAAVFDGHARTP